ncbi:hypothetical protein OEZ86_007739 [Tetradesmus obliquus]|nr:hypothetical protein OEZ86_007739 [Tetradesmus obliquus]
MPEQQQQQQQQQEQTTSGQQQQVKMVLVVAVALIDSQHRLLLAQRPPGKAMAGLWEFPGGKVDAGETPEAALVRELQEELSIQVIGTLQVFVQPCSVCDAWLLLHARRGPVPLVRELQEELSIQVEPRDLQPLTFASHTYDSFHLLMPLYVCRKWSGQLRGVEGQQLAWVSPRQLHDYPMPAADVPLVAPVLQAMEAGRTLPA